MLTTEQKARVWDRLKRVWEKGRDDEANDTESRDICRVLAEQMRVIEEKVFSVDAENDTTAAMDKAFEYFQVQPDTKEELDFIIRVAPDRRWDGEARGFFAGWNAANGLGCQA